MAVKKPAAGKVKSFNIKSQIKQADKEKTGVARYAGEKPPPGAYVVALKRIWIEQANDTTIFRYLAEIADPRSSKKEYNGYPIWGRQGITDKGIGFVNQFLKVLDDGKGEALDQFYETGNLKTKADEKGVEHLLKIGDFKVGSPNLDIKFLGVCDDNSYTDKKTKKRVTNLQINSYVPLSESELEEASSVSDDDDEDDEDVIEADDDVEDDDIEDDDEDEDDDDEDDDDEDEDEDDEYEEDDEIFDDEDDE
ncbi:hypothetical protein SEA_LITTLEFELLA_64 [Gordonia phage LittleFella]|nr:hypothetical protein SEA_LITTLEFELLA_64 [Gordonia phage LittleFella]